MRFAFFPYGSRGDVQPMLGLARTLRAQGHDVVLGAAPTFRAFIEDAGIAFHPTGNDFEGWMRTKGEELSHRPTRLLRALGEYIERDIPEAFAGTLEAARGADLVVSVSLQQAAPSVAAHLGIPFRSLLYCPQSLRSSAWPPLNIARTNMPGILNRVAWASMTMVMNRMILRPLNTARAALGLPAVDDAVAHLVTAEPIVVADAPIAGALPPDVGRATLTGALVLDHAPPLDDTIERFLEAGSPPLYVGFGSMGARDPEAATAAVLDAARRLSTRLILAGGWGALVKPTTTSDDVLYIQGAPHTRVFPRCRFVVHHGGAGTTTAAARAGVPQLVVAHAADQYFWGDRVEALCVGPPLLDRPGLSAAFLHDRLHAALTDEGMTARARALGKELAKIDGNALTAAALIDDARRARPAA